MYIVIALSPPLWQPQMLNLQQMKQCQTISPTNVQICQPQICNKLESPTNYTKLQPQM